MLKILKKISLSPIFLLMLPVETNFLYTKIIKKIKIIISIKKIFYIKVMIIAFLEVVLMLLLKEK